MIMRTRTLLLVLTTISCGCFYSINALATISAEQDTIDEGDSMELCVSLDPLQNATVVLQVSTFSGTVLEGMDFDLSSATIPFTIGGLSQKCIDFIAHEDNAVESGELVRIGLGGIAVGSPDAALITISDTSRINVSFTSESFSVGEDDGTVSVCATIVGGSIERSVAVVVEPDNTGTATANDDYVFAGAVSKSFSPVMASDPVCVNIAIQSDTIIEEMETFFVTLSPGLEAVNVIMSSATVFITDTDNAGLTISPTFLQVLEGDSGLTNVNVNLMVSLNGNTLDRDIVVLINTADAQATVENNDYVQLVNEPFTIPSTASDGDSYTFTAHIVGDEVEEGNERFSLLFTTENSNDQFGINRVIVLVQNDADVVRDCGGLDDPTNGQVTISPNTLQDSTATYSCQIGFDLNGLETRTCLNLGGWEGEAPTCQIVNCGDLEEPDRGSILISTTDYQGQAIYSCGSGYELDTGTPTVTRNCELNGMWSGEVPQCVRVSCGFLTEPNNGIIRYPDGGTLFGDRAEYVCDAGYNLEGTPERTCQNDRSWALTEPTCEPVNCGELANPVNGLVSVSTIFFPGVASYSCNTNFELVNGPEERQCQTNGTWSESPPTCQVIQCPTLLDPDNGGVNIQVDIDGNTMASYSCDQGYDLNGNTTRTCQTNSEWSGSGVTCDIISCPDRDDPTDGVVSLNSTTFQSVAEYECDTGHTLRGSSTATCLANGMWSSGPPFCDIVDCPVLTNPGNGSVLFSQLVFSSEATYTCNAGFMISGLTTRVCEDSGEWSGEEPTCEEIFCPSLNVTNGMINTTDDYRTGSVATVQCTAGYTLNGESSLTCQSTGEWTADEPTCEIIACPDLSVVNGNVAYTDDTLPGSIATVTCNSDLTLIGPLSRTCMDDGEWSGEENICSGISIGPTGGGSGQSNELETSTIIGIAVGGVAFLIILIIIIAVSVLICCGIRKKKIYKKYVLPYRTYIYDNTQRSSGGPLSDAEIRQWESQTRQHAVDAVDALEKNDTVND